MCEPYSEPETKLPVLNLQDLIQTKLGVRVEQPALENFIHAHWTNIAKYAHG
jgi:hypothetical protein